MLKNYSLSLVTNRFSVTYTQYTIYNTIYTLFMHSGSMLMIFLCIHFIHIIFIYTNRKALSFVVYRTCTFIYRNYLDLENCLDCIGIQAGFDQLTHTYLCTLRTRTQRFYGYSCKSGNPFNLNSHYFRVNPFLWISLLGSDQCEFFH